MKAYDIGQITVQNDKKFTDRHIGPTGNYTVVYPSFSLDVQLLNESGKTMAINIVDDLNKRLSYRFDQATKLAPHEYAYLVVPSFDVKDEGKFDFYTVTPIVHYTLDGQEHRSLCLAYCMASWTPISIK